MVTVYTRKWPWLLTLVCCTFSLWAQDEVSILRARTVNNTHSPTAFVASEQAFTFQRNLIFFLAKVNGNVGNFILDTGAPTLLLNSRGESSAELLEQEGVAAGGVVHVANRRVESFEMGGVDLGKRWALTLDLRAMEQRTGQQIDGYVGHDLLKNNELRIDFPSRSFRLLRPERRPLLTGVAPRAALSFDFYDHLPVITIKVGKRKLRFVIDTGAGVNLIDKRLQDYAKETGKKMNVQGLDGSNQDYDVVRLSNLSEFEELGKEEMEFVAMDLSHLQTPGLPPLAGIIGSSSLQDFVVSINYRHQKIFFW